MTDLSRKSLDNVVEIALEEQTYANKSAYQANLVQQQDNIGTVLLLNILDQG